MQSVSIDLYINPLVSKVSDKYIAYIKINKKIVPLTLISSYLC